MAKEPIPTIKVPCNHYFLSAGKSIIYQVISGMCCRLYWQQYDDPDLSDSAKDYFNWVIADDKIEAISAWKTESAWYESADKGWVRDGPNFPSYEVRMLDLDHYLENGEIQYFKSTYITLRHDPIQSDNLLSLLPIVLNQRFTYQNNPVRPVVKLPPTRSLVA